MTFGALARPRSPEPVLRHTGRIRNHAPVTNGPRRGRPVRHQIRRPRCGREKCELYEGVTTEAIHHQPGRNARAIIW